MTQETITGGQALARPTAVATVAAFVLPTLSVVAACVIATATGLAIPIERPAVLIAACVLVAAPLRHERLRTIQRIVALYLICVPINETHLRYLSIPMGSLNVSLAYSAIPLAILGAGYVAAGRRSRGDGEDPSGSGLLGGWLLAGVILLVHMALLGVLLHKVYGYGYERDIHVLGSLALYFLVFLTTWRSLGHTRLRQVLGLILAAFYLWLTASNG